MENLFQGKLVRLAGIDPEEVSKSFSRNGTAIRNTCACWIATRRACTRSKAIKEWMEKTRKEGHSGSRSAPWKMTGCWVISPCRSSTGAAARRLSGSGIGERDFWGKGYGTDAMKLILRYGFSNSTCGA
jgi:hypothetical protein